MKQASMGGIAIVQIPAGALLSYGHECPSVAKAFSMSHWIPVKEEESCLRKWT